MATGWMKSLQCKSRAFDDVAPNHHRRRHRHAASNSSDPIKTHTHTHRLHSLTTSASCRNSVQNLKDIVETTTATKPKKQKPPNQKAPPPPPSFRRPPAPPAAPLRTRSASAESFFPSLTELPQGHPSRNVVEIIFHTGWGEKPFSGRVEMVFKVQNLNRTVARFEEYRELVKSRVAAVGGGEDGGEDDQARCVADGNEVMRFYCLGATSGGGAYEAGCGAWELYGGKGAALCTYSGSGCAHEKGGGGSGRRAMLVCRVIAGRVCKENGYGPMLEGRVGYDSVNKESGELLVFDTRALLPCFLIIYNKL